MDKNKKRIARYGRHARVREKVKGTDTRPRLCVFRSLQHIYAQVIDDSQGNTLVSASTIDPEIKNDICSFQMGPSRERRDESIPMLPSIPNWFMFPSLVRISISEESLPP